MKVYTYFNTQRKNSEGEIPISVVVYRPSLSRLYISTGLRSKTTFPDCIFPRTERNHKAKTIRLNEIVSQIEEIALENSLLPNDQLKEKILTKVFGVNVNIKTLADRLREYARTCKAQSTSEKYIFTAKKVEEYDKNATLDINYVWLEDFTTWMLTTIKVNSASIHLRCIRAVFNRCRKREETNNYPFTHFSIPSEETMNRVIHVEELKNLRDMELKPHLQKYRDIFLLSFYLIGINMIDLLTAKKEQMVDGRLNYRRSKTHKLYSVLVQPEAMTIIEKYRGNEYLLRFCEKAHYRSVTDKLNAFLKQIIPNLTSYYARHTWATLASKIDIPIDTISAALGHSHGSAVTNIYIQFDQKKVDEANRKVLDLLL